MTQHLIEPHGGTLKNLMANKERAAELKRLSRDWPSWDLTPRHICDLELLLNGSFSPLEGFMTKGDYEGVCGKMQLGDGTLWPLPIVLDVTEDVAGDLKNGDTLALRDPEGTMLAALHVEQVWEADRSAEAQQVFGTTSVEHPGTKYLLEQTHPYYVGGKLEGVAMPGHYDFLELRVTPADLREEICLARLAKSSSFSDSQSHAPCPSGVDVSSCSRVRSKPVDPSGRRDDKTGRC